MYIRGFFLLFLFINCFIFFDEWGLFRGVFVLMKSCFEGLFVFYLFVDIYILNFLVLKLGYSLKNKVLVNICISN